MEKAQEAIKHNQKAYKAEDFPNATGAKSSESVN